MFFIHEEKQIYSLVNKKCPRPATTDPNEPYNTESRAQGMFSTSKIPRSLKGFPFPGFPGSGAAAMGTISAAAPPAIKVFKQMFKNTV